MAAVMADGSTTGERKVSYDAFIDALDIHLDLMILYTSGDWKISSWGAWRAQCCLPCYITINMGLSNLPV